MSQSLEIAIWVHPRVSLGHCAHVFADLGALDPGRFHHLRWSSALANTRHILIYS